MNETPRISMEGAGALLIDGADGPFSTETQERVWAVAAAARAMDGVREAVPGMNNLMVVFDPLTPDPERFGIRLRALWHETRPGQTGGREIEIPVAYGGEGGEDLVTLAAHAGLSPPEVVDLHARSVYSVAAVGAMPGFVYLSGLDPRLTMPRRAVPRMTVPVGSVIIGGSQAGIMPVTAPSGWHIIGRTPFVLFDALRDPPAAFRPGDRIRFRPQGGPS